MAKTGATKQFRIWKKSSDLNAYISIPASSFQFTLVLWASLEHTKLFGRVDLFRFPDKSTPIGPLGDSGGPESGKKRGVPIGVPNR
ncbi:hypothetical protein N7462_008045 [Penicillium macrosclerotiorum]|uniref:uncharacterized protein n=1 Tax=Penicillium macrosclerotiorum TaxID=303699 RepID=UPI002548F655|nr:uncharacterized protein N7462_008045 [Penicillium macrosclerotiorum]KAJ5679801.1 hypothetical protein N7462_008045 [Penicillium macrosclerotiorum]